MKKKTIPFPDAEQKEKKLKIHGDVRIDPYYWMKDRDDEQVKEYLNSENDFTAQKLADTEELQSAIYDEIIGRIKPDEMSIPYEMNGYIYYRKYEKGKEYPIHLRKQKGEDNTEKKVILNINNRAEGHEYYHVNSLSISPDNKWLAFGVDTVSRRIYTIYFKNLETGEILEETIENTTGRSTWAGDSKTIYFTTKDETLRPNKIWRYTIGEPDSRSLVYEENDPTFLTYIYKTRSRDYLIIGSYSTLSQEYRYLHVDDMKGNFTVFQERDKELEYSIAHGGGEDFYVLTNLDAENFRLMQCKLGKTDKKHWKEVIRHREDVLVEDVDVFADYLVLSERKDGLTQARIIGRRNSSIDYYFPTEDEVYVLSPVYNHEFNTNSLKIAYQSMIKPSTYYNCEMKTGKTTVIKEKEVPNYDASLYKTERRWATAEDGRRVPISLVCKKEIEQDGDNPLLLYGYGSYGHSIEPGFSFSRASLLDRGFIFAIAHIRGGSEMGRYWYEEGKLLQKKNTFTDFIACANALIEHNYTSRDKIAAMGGSAGGLLMGAVVNMKPELFRAVVAIVPFVDVITTMLDESIPLTTGEYDEWGNPNEKKYYDYIKSYSPYDNLSKTKYPAMLVMTGFHDSQVQYWEPAKWVAKIRDLNTGNHPVLLHTNMETGHSGESGRYQRYKETAMEYAFLVDELIE